MGFLSPLLEIQDIDRACDRLCEQREGLPERKQLAKAQSRVDAIDAAHQGLVERRAELARGEHAVADEVEATAARAQGVERTMYDGTVTAAKDLAALQQEIGHIRETQSELEEKEMALLEQIEALEGEMAENRRERDAALGERGEVEALLRAAEAVIDDELAAFERDRTAHAEQIPAAILEEYGHLRKREKLHGVAAALFTDKGCDGCRMQLPRLEAARMRAEPEDALLRCENCGRLLVR